MTTPQQDPKRRENGYYWVKDLEKWGIMEWSSLGWVGHFRFHNDSELEEIDERRLTHEDAKRIAELEHLSETFIKSLEILRTYQNAEFQEVIDLIDLSIAKAKDKLRKP